MKRLKTASREYKGCINFMNWMKENYNETCRLIVFKLLKFREYDSI